METTRISPSGSGAVDIAVVGELCVDLILSGDVTPAFGQAEKLVDDAVLTIGSSSAIFACGAARLGLKVAFHGVVGDDVFGHFMVDALRERGIVTAGIVVDPGLRTGITVHLSRGVDRAMLTYSGSIGALHMRHCNLAAVLQARHLHLGSYYLLDALRADVPALFAAAHAQGISVSLDTNYDPSEQWDGGIAQTLAHVDLFLPNETESMAITRQPNWQAALEQLAAQVPLVALKRGADGATAQQGSRRVEAATPRIKVVDTTGAGDSFDAGFVYGRLAGWPLEQALRLGCVCGALSTQGPGGTTAQPTLAQAMALLDATQ
ncbi:MAG: carbohydrate kinase family protein [Caldilineaceae bacterium]